MKRFEGKVVLVTGAGSGIGAACVRRLYDEGAAVVAGDVRKDEVDARVAELGGGKRLAAVGVDVTHREQVAAFVARAASMPGELFGLVNCAGIRGVGSVFDTDPDNLRRVLSVNLEGMFNVCQVFAQTMRDGKKRGAIVNLSSTAGIRGVANRIPYAASKYGVSGITQTMALELGPHGIRANAIAPGMIRTPFVAALFQDPENVKRIAADHPIGRYGEPEDIASVAAFLLSEDAAFMTGAVVPVDGGKSVGIPSR